MLEVRQVPARVLAEKDEQQLQANQGRREQFKHRFLIHTIRRHPPQGIT